MSVANQRTDFSHNFMPKILLIAVNAGENRITRASTDSALTIPYERTFRDLDTNRPGANTPELEQFNFCGCGWPQHMLLPSKKL